MLSGVLNSDGTINNEASIKRLAEVAVAYAKAGDIFNQVVNVRFICFHSSVFIQ
jgi:delta-aminolevulinic acid dehydratase/porphobilinogen synthase